MLDQREETNGGATSSAISLPAGGGSLQGIGETFQPDLFTGSGQLTVPITVTPGRDGFGPELTLTYSAGFGNGLFGFGWSLSVPRITRKTATGLPRYDDDDVFQLSGYEDLVPVLESDGSHEAEPVGGYQVTRYRPRTEGLFARIERWRALDGETHWRVTTREDVTHVYGRSRGARISDPDDEGRVFEWLIEESLDARGHHVLYEYAGDEPAQQIARLAERNRRYAQRYIRRVLYGNYPATEATLLYPGTPNAVGVLRSGTDHGDPAGSIDRRYAFEVVFDYGDREDVDWEHVLAQTGGDQTLREADIAYEDPPEMPVGSGPESFVHPETPISTLAPHQTRVPLRPDPHSSYRPGFELRTLRACRRALVFHHLPALGKPQLVRATNFLYEENADNCFLFLRQVVITGYRYLKATDAYRQRSLPALSLRYSSFEPKSQRYRSVDAEGGCHPPLSLSHPDVTLVDVVGDGLPDVVESTETGFRYWRNLGGGRLDRPRYMEDGPAGIRLSDPGVAFGDMSGDGKVDLLVHAGGVRGYFEIDGGGGWSRRSFRHHHNSPSRGLEEASARLIDLTGDGRSDLLLTDEEDFVWFRSEGEEGFSEQEHVPRLRDLDRFPDVVLDDPGRRVRLADMTGDGLSDVVLVTDGRIDYWPNLGYGRFGERITMERSPRLAGGIDPRRLFLADVDGSGVADLVYVDHDSVRFWFNQGGNGWSLEHRIQGTPVTHDLTGVELADFFGSGTTSILWSEDAVLQGGSNYKVLDLCGGKKPYLLVERDNGLGAATRVRYVSSTEHYLQDEGDPRTRWLTRLPSPVQVIDKTETIDRIGRTKLVTRYRYHHGYYDGSEREFRGFARVDKIDTEVFEEFSRPGLSDEAFGNAAAKFASPPVETRSWFHTGFAYDEDLEGFDGRQLYEQLRDREYWSGDASAYRLDGPVVEASSKPLQAWRALHGALLRSEVFGLDGSDREVHPYTVTETNYRVRELQPVGPQPYGVFHRGVEGTLTHVYERRPDDPRVSHRIVARTDEFGNVTDELRVDYPRRGSGHSPEQLALRATYDWFRFVNDVATRERHYVSLPCEHRSFEVGAPPPGWGGDRLLAASDFEELLIHPEHPSEHVFRPSEQVAEAFSLRLLEWTQTYYRASEDPGALDAPDEVTHRLPLGQVGRAALVYETYRATWSPGLLTELYEGAVDATLLHEAGYVDSSTLDTADAFWPTEVEGLLEYVWAPSGKTAFAPEGFLLPVVEQDAFGNRSETTYDATLQGSERTEHFLVPVRKEDAVGNVTTADVDYRVVRPYRIVDPNGALQEVAIDALGRVVGTAVRGHQGEGDRLYKAGSIADLEGFEPDLAGTELMAWRNAPESTAAGLLSGATTRIIYDLHRAVLGIEPVVTATLVREEHGSVLVEDPAREHRIQQVLEYADGFGHVLQTRTLAGSEAGTESWIATGTVQLDNKGQPVREFEPFLDGDAEYGLEIHGVSSTTLRDPVGRIVAIVRPNGAYEKVVFDSWRRAEWDGNDTVHPLQRYDAVAGVLPQFDFDPAEDPDVGPLIARLPQAEYLPTWYGARRDSGVAAARWPDPVERAAEVAAAMKVAHHSATPAVYHLDSSGRDFASVGDAGDDPSGSPVLFETLVEFDVLGLPRRIRDPRGVDSLVHGFDMLGRQVLVDGKDHGRKQTLLDVQGQTIAVWDAEGNESRLSYDVLRRPTERWLKKPGGPWVLVEKHVFGEDRPDAVSSYSRGRLWRSYDGAGRAETVAYDFHGYSIETVRTLLRDGQAQVEWAATSSPSGGAPFDEGAATTLLDPSLTFSTSGEFDALGRVVRDVSAEGSVQEQVYDRAGRLVRTLLTRRGVGAPEVIIDSVEYDAHGRRTSVVRGNGVSTTYEYDGETFRLQRKWTTRDGRQLQDLHYVHDPAGNVIEVSDAAHAVLFNHNTRIEAATRYRYDAVYRLIEASGREHEAATACQYQAGGRRAEFIGLRPQPHTNGKALGNYSRSYRYDASGNLTRIGHVNHTTGVSWQRIQEFAPDSNRLVSSKASCPGEGGFVIPYDANGNVGGLPHLPSMVWDHAGRLIRVQLDAGSSPDMAFYQYGANGRRIRKQVAKGGGAHVEERVYVGACEIYTKRNGAGAAVRRDTVHVFDGDDRLARLEEEKAPNDPSVVVDTRVRHQLTDHISSSVMEVSGDDLASVISFEEYYPYGGTSYQAGRDLVETSRKRYRYSGKEQDEETGLYEFGRRYFAPWLGRWMSVDPLGAMGGKNLYAFARNNPVRWIDPVGLAPYERLPVERPRDKSPPSGAGNPGIRRETMFVGDREYVIYEAVRGTWVSSSAKAENVPYAKETAYGAYLDQVLDISGQPLLHPDDIEPGDLYLVPAGPEIVPVPPTPEPKFTRFMADADLGCASYNCQATGSWLDSKADGARLKAVSGRAGIGANGVEAEGKAFDLDVDVLSGKGNIVFGGAEAGILINHKTVDEEGNETTRHKAGGTLTLISGTGEIPIGDDQLILGASAGVGLSGERKTVTTADKVRKRTVVNILFLTVGYEGVEDRTVQNPAPRSDTKGMR